MEYISNKPWVGEKYHEQTNKILIIISLVTYGIDKKTTATYSEKIEDSIIDYVNDFIDNQNVRDGKYLQQIPQILAKQTMGDTNRIEFLSKYAYYLPYTIDKQNRLPIREMINGWATQEFYRVLEMLQPNKIIVASHVVYDDLPIPHKLHEFEIKHKDYEYLIDGVLQKGKLEYQNFSIKEYLINQKPIYALKMYNATIYRVIGNGISLGAFQLEKYFEYIEQLESKK